MHQTPQPRSHRPVANLSLLKMLDKNANAFKSSNQLMTQEELLQQLVPIIKKNSKLRRNDERNLLTQLLQQIEFFKSKGNLSVEDYRTIGNSLHYEKILQNENVFEYGSFGNKFYIILKGSVGVKIPTKRQEAKEYKKEIKHHKTSSKGAQTEFNQNEINPEKEEKNKESDDDIDSEEEREKLFQKRKSKMSVVDMKHQFQERAKSVVYVEVAQLSEGSSFGELALIQNKPRAATIMCKEDCEFAVMERQDYERILKKRELESLDKLLEFLRSLPQFKNWSKRGLAKIHFYFERKRFSRNQYVFKAGEPIQYVYIVVDGEFHVTTRVERVCKKPINILDYIGPNLEKRSHEKKGSPIRCQLEKKREVVQIVKLGAGKMFGEEDIMTESNHTTSVFCSSVAGELLAMPAHEFIRRVVSNEDSMSIINKSVHEKKQKVLQRLNSSERLYLQRKRLEERNLLKKFRDNFPNLNQYPTFQILRNSQKEDLFGTGELQKIQIHNISKPKKLSKQTKIKDSPQKLDKLKEKMEDRNGFFTTQTHFNNERKKKIEEPDSEDESDLHLPNPKIIRISKVHKIPEQTSPTKNPIPAKPPLIKYVGKRNFNMWDHDPDMEKKLFKIMRKSRTISRTARPTPKAATDKFNILNYLCLSPKQRKDTPSSPIHKTFHHKSESKINRKKQKDLHLRSSVTPLKQASQNINHYQSVESDEKINQITKTNLRQRLTVTRNTINNYYTNALQAHTEGNYSSNNNYINNYNTASPTPLLSTRVGSRKLSPLGDARIIDGFMSSLDTNQRIRKTRKKNFTYMRTAYLL